MIRSAGGVVCRAERSRHLEILLVHRSRQDDWSLPKGKLHRDEPALACALREVREETGLLCLPTAPLPELEYVDRRGRDRLVAFWIMTAFGGEFRKNDEVDRLRWVRADRAAAALTHEREASIVELVHRGKIVAA